MNIGFFSEAGYEGKVSRDNPNMRTDVAWVCALGATHHPIHKLHELSDNLYDIVIQYSSIEHSGLGRYGDYLDPEGDLKAMNDIYDNLHKTESEFYPHHYDILENKGELYNKYLEDRETFKSKIKISKSSTDARNDITEKMEKYDSRALEKYTNDTRHNFYL